jgi:hypothetical protein
VIGRPPLILRRLHADLRPAMGWLTRITSIAGRVGDRVERIDRPEVSTGRGAEYVRKTLVTVFLIFAAYSSVTSLAAGGVPGPAVLLLLLLAGVLWTNRLGRFIRDWSPVVAILAAYIIAFGVVSRLKLPAYYSPQLDADKLIGFGHLPTALLQDWIGRPSLGLELLSVGAYLTHFFFPLCIGFYLWARRSNGFRELLYADIAVSVLASITQILAPTAPPWLAAKHGMAPGVHDVLRAALSDVGLPELARLKGDGHAYNIVAAFPSIHAAFPVLGMIVAIRYRVPIWLKVAQALQLAAVWFVIVYTGEHYVIDVVGGVLYAFAAIWMVRRVLAAVDARRALRAPPVPAVEPVPVPVQINA